eukprot:scaffold539500_cov52-Prasinocladus_malaysianus.AAC.1
MTRRRLTKRTTTRMTPLGLRTRMTMKATTRTRRAAMAIATRARAPRSAIWRAIRPERHAGRCLSTV